MDDVEVLVKTFYSYKKEPEEDDSQNPDDALEEEEEEEDFGPAHLKIDIDDIIDILDKFHKDREDKMVNDQLVGVPRAKKKSNFETEEQKAEREKRK